MTANKLPDSAVELIGDIEERIYVIRKKRVVLDRDLASIYQVETRVLNQALKRNLKRFPPDFVFQLNEREVEALVNSSQFVMSSGKHRGATYRPFAFTEHGAVMLACTSPEVLIPAIASVTTSMRVGSGGVMLPHYSPLKVAENFSMLSGLSCGWYPPVPGGGMCLS